MYFPFFHKTTCYFVFFLSLGGDGVNCTSFERVVTRNTVITDSGYWENLSGQYYPRFVFLFCHCIKYCVRFSERFFGLLIESFRNNSPLIISFKYWWFCIIIWKWKFVLILSAIFFFFCPNGCLYILSPFLYLWVIFLLPFVFTYLSVKCFAI